MLLSYDDKKQLMNRFPEIELSYETILHTKVYGEAYMIIPKGAKMFAWFTFWKNQNVCFFIKLNEKGNISISDIQVYPVCFINELAFGTIFYGTWFAVKGINHFSCEDIFYYKGKNVSNDPFEQKIQLIGKVFKQQEIKQRAYTKNSVLFGLPIMNPNYTQAFECALTLSYSVYGIQVHTLEANENLGIFLLKNQRMTLEANFKLKATLQADIYHLYCYDPKEENIPYGIALVPTYKSSVMLNSLFRTIKENANLDLLEESDDDEEFENNAEDKFVNLNKGLVMKCIYNKKFKKWEPISVITGHTKLITYKEAKLLEN
jgi:hypothetical protein